MSKKTIGDLRVIGVPWHTAHQYELAKLFKEYHFLRNFYRTWGDVSRPLPENVTHVLTVDQSKYDLAILHVDQQCVHDRYNKARLFRQFKAVTEGMPRVVINHMTPFDDKLETEQVIDKMRDLIGDIPMVTNSRQAAKQWGWGNPIIHGMSIDEWPSRPKEVRVITTLSTGGMSTAYRRELLLVTIEYLEERGLTHKWILNDTKFETFKDYQDYISRSLLYFNPTYQSPMPRSRTEAMLSGACVVSTKHHDWADYIEDKKTGFLIPDNPRSAADLLEYLMNDGYDEAVRVGEAGRKFAQATFNIDNFRSQWSDLLTKLGVLS